jgi:hypothetical protein
MAAKGMAEKQSDPGSIAEGTSWRRQGIPFRIAIHPVPLNPFPPIPE